MNCGILLLTHSIGHCQIFLYACNYSQSLKQRFVVWKLFDTTEIHIKMSSAMQWNAAGDKSVNHDNYCQSTLIIAVQSVLLITYAHNLIVSNDLLTKV